MRHCYSTTPVKRSQMAVFLYESSPAAVKQPGCMDLGYGRRVKRYFAAASRLLTSFQLMTL